MESSFIKHTKKGDDKSSTWFYFLISTSSEEAKCIKCNAVLKTKGGSTKGLHEHLKVHGIKLCREATPTIAVPKKVAKITSHFSPKNEENIRAIMASLVAVDGLAFSTIAQSKQIRKGMEARKFKVPKSDTTIRKYVMEYFEECHERVKKEIIDLKVKNNRFSISFDEWTSVANKRYLNLILHGQKNIWNLGLVRIKGAATSENCIDMIESRLVDYDLSLATDIISIITDGASTMLKIGKRIGPHQQLCLAHGIQLGILDVMYKRQIRIEPNEISICEDDDSEEDTRDQTDCIQLADNEERGELTDEFDIKKIIDKIRSVVRSFRKSPKKNEILQKYVKMEFNKELQLILDCQTRWNSLLKMIERFHMLESCLKKAMVDLKADCLKDFEFNIIKSIIKVLKPAELAIEALCRRDMNLSSVDAVIHFMLDEVKNVDLSIAFNLFESIKKRVSERRTIYTNILKLLITGNFVSTTNEPNLEEMTNTIVEIVKKYNTNDVENRDIDLKIIENEKEKTLKQRLQETVKESRVLKRDVSLSVEEAVPKEINLLLGGGGLGSNLEVACNFLKTIPPTSVECERCFSVSGRICTKIRSSLNDETMDALVFLKY
ncbi:uncharacterized protein LOC126765534 [Bactrocera neohumeralis]|uniref:uncharacterized protein LOC126765534 n=1 Tax=Bactrocera neohumeralis TaxID=98809 RepID=UPI0021666943|nr:uncharacterized protein LOC126765534 [Bactrocera neohumeralis]